MLRFHNGRQRLWSSDHKIPTEHNHIHRTRAQLRHYHSLIYYAAYRSTYAYVVVAVHDQLCGRAMCTMPSRPSAVMPNCAPVAVANAVSGTACADVLSFLCFPSRSCTYIYIHPGGFIRTNQTFSPMQSVVHRSIRLRACVPCHFYSP